jgi:hypothetical protein
MPAAMPTTQPVALGTAITVVVNAALTVAVSHGWLETGTAVAIGTVVAGLLARFTHNAVTPLSDPDVPGKVLVDAPEAAVKPKRRRARRKPAPKPPKAPETTPG